MSSVVGRVNSRTLFMIAAILTIVNFCTANAQENSSDAVEALKLYVMPQSGPFRPDQIPVPQQELISAWARSAHADASAEAFTHWDGEGEIPANCAACHSGAGFRDFHGLDGSAPGIEGPTPVGGVVDCDTCHNPGLGEIAAITLPSGIEHPVAPGAQAACMTCHIGREAGVSVTRAVGEKAADTPDPSINFVNPHYALAGAMWLGSIGGGGFEYPGKSYSGLFFHARPINDCASCHDPHTLTVAEQTCLSCHESGAPGAIRISRISYDGSGDLSKGIRSDIEANSALLLKTIQDYSVDIAGAPIVFEHSYPYFFLDADQDGRGDRIDGKPQTYKSWTPRMLKAAYNWKFVNADSGAFVHNPHYALELLYDSIEDLAGPLNIDVEALGIQR
ncbi:Formate-dependent nitrite reductase, periplasmic cytochrome c552 subunit [Martelella mediterranea DSM 17316]|uniref:Formate-dependent nitrite reductase, periplasmic cytochrome c552 subunit n=2 Tax=Martelella mediterranea TaxID=293089 RepID=A0A1U9Z197_9HYPH|nr:Formate-dependent nitrite reductase, periplasmic cytochrome c552 subunit [Martelella mediterranea DSM 17316]